MKTTPDDAWGTDATDSGVEALRQSRANRNLVRTILLARVLGDDRPACPDQQALVDSLQRWDAVPAGALAVILSSPAYDHWAHLADNVRRRLENLEPVVDKDLPSYVNLGNDSCDAVGSFLRDHARFQLEVAILARTSGRGKAVAWGGCLPLSHWGLLLEVDGESSVDWALDAADANGHLLRLGSRTLPVGRLAHGDTSELAGIAGCTVAPELRGHHRAIRFFDRDPLLAREWIKPFVNPDGSRYLPPPEDMAPFIQGYSDGLRLLEECWPAMAMDLWTGVHTIVPVGRPGPERGVSCSSDTFFGALLACDNPPILAAEVLVHEFSHNVFNEVVARDRLFTPAANSADNVYSPWREDPRPPMGLFHGLFAFARVCLFYSKYLEASAAEPEVVARHQLLLACARVACNRLEGVVGLTRVGAALLSLITRQVGDMALGRHGQLTDEVRTAVTVHFTNWGERYPGLIDGNQPVFEQERTALI